MLFPPTMMAGDFEIGRAMLRNSKDSEQILELLISLIKKKTKLCPDKKEKDIVRDIEKSTGFKEGDLCYEMNAISLVCTVFYYQKPGHFLGERIATYCIDHAALYRCDDGQIVKFYNGMLMINFPILVPINIINCDCIGSNCCND